MMGTWYGAGSNGVGGYSEIGPVYNFACVDDHMMGITLFVQKAIYQYTSIDGYLWSWLQEVPGLKSYFFWFLVS